MPYTITLDVTPTSIVRSLMREPDLAAHVHALLGAVLDPPTTPPVVATPRCRPDRTPTPHSTPPLVPKTGADDSASRSASLA